MSGDSEKLAELSLLLKVRWITEILVGASVTIIIFMQAPSKEVVRSLCREAFVHRYGPGTRHIRSSKPKLVAFSQFRI